MGRAVPTLSMMERLDGGGIAAARKALSIALTDRDRGARTLGEVEDLDVPGDDGLLPARLYRAGQTDAPPLVYFHGGGFTFCDIGTHDALCRRLAYGAGQSILSVGYRLAPEHAWPTQMDDALAAVRSVAAAHPDRPLIVGGDSAGGYLALQVARILNRERAGAVRQTFLIYPLLHLDDSIWATHNAGLRRLGRFAVGQIRTRLVDPPPSLLEDGVAGDPPCVLTYGGLADPVSPDCIAYETALRSAGIAVEARTFRSLPHGYANMTHLLPAARKAIDETAALLRRVASQA